MTESGEASTFTLMDVFRDAVANVRATWPIHFAWCLSFLALMLVCCCGVSCLIMPLVGVMGVTLPQERGTDPPMVLMGVIYLAFIVTYLLLFTLYEGVTLEITHAQSRGEAIGLRAALDTSLRRAPTLIGGVFLRVAVDLVPPALLMSAGAAVLAVSIGDPSSESARTITAIGITAAYFALLGWVLFARAYFGLALSCIVRDSLGPRDAFEKSMSLLRGRRWHFLAFRLAFFVVGFGIYCLSFSPMFALAGLPSPELQHTEDMRSLLGLAMLPLLLLVYVVMLALYALDTILVATYHARIARPIDASSLAKVFE